MKKTIIIAFFLLGSFSSEAQFTRARLQASGLTCSLCNNAIYKALKSLSFAASVETDIKNASFDVVFKNGAVVDIDAMKDAVEDAGFSVASFQITGNFNQVSIDNDKHVVIGNRHFHFLKVKPQVLNGQQTITVVDKNFLTARNFKQFSSATKRACVQTGKAGSCTEKGEELSADTRIYHVTI